jgi:hypothetical protein
VDSLNWPLTNAFLDRTKVDSMRLKRLSSSESLEEGLSILIREGGRYRGFGARGGGPRVDIVLKWIVDFGSI